MAKSKKRRKAIIFSLIVVVLGGLTVAAVTRKREVVITVQTEKATRRNLVETVTANGKIQPVVKVNISPEVSGEIIELPVKEGQRVQKGDLILKIKPDFYQAARNQALAAYQSSLAGKDTAQATLARTEAEFKRNQDLFAQKLVSDSAFDQVKADYEVAKAQLSSAEHQVEMARASLASADDSLAKTTIVSPLTGTVSKLNSETGERVVGTATMAGTEVMTIADLNEMEARVDIGEMDVVLIAPAQCVHLEVDAFKDRKFNGLVTEIANSSKNAGFSSGSSQDATKFEVRIRIKEKEAFRPGMSVTAEIETRSRTNVLTVPIASVTTRVPAEKKPEAKLAARDRSKTNSPSVRAKAATTQTNLPSTNATATLASAGASSLTNDLVSTGTTNMTPGKSGEPASPTAAASDGTNSAAADKKSKEAAKPIEVVFVRDGDRAKMVPVKRGICDDSFWEITEGLQDGQEIVSGGFRAVSHDLEDGKKIRKGVVAPDLSKDGKKSD